MGTLLDIRFGATVFRLHCSIRFVYHKGGRNAMSWVAGSTKYYNSRISRSFFESSSGFDARWLLNCQLCYAFRHKVTCIQTRQHNWDMIRYGPMLKGWLLLAWKGVFNWCYNTAVYIHSSMMMCVEGITGNPSSQIRLETRELLGSPAITTRKNPCERYYWQQATSISWRNCAQSSLICRWSYFR